LMKHFGTHTRVEGVDLYHACYAGTSALFSAIEWMMGPWWNGKKAIVICADIAQFDSSLHFMNGAGAVALLISYQGNGIVEPIRCTSCTNEYDFYKPISLPFPVVNGRESMNVYLSKLNECIDQIDQESIKNCKYWIFHCASVINSLKGTKEVCKRLCLSSEIEHLYDEKVKPSTEWISESGSLFTASLFTGLANVLYHNVYNPDDNILMYAFGSGAMASLYIIKLKGHVSIYQPWDTQDRVKLSLDKWSDL
jgi:3-hydroxy-3-methylglutaryl CoA synthase